jgi:hypothetical protein
MYLILPLRPVPSFPINQNAMAPMSKRFIIIKDRRGRANSFLPNPARPQSFKEEAGRMFSLPERKGFAYDKN